MRKDDYKAAGYMLLSAAISYLLAGPGWAIAVLALGGVLVVIGHAEGIAAAFGKSEHSVILDADGQKVRLRHEPKSWMTKAVLGIALLTVSASAVVRIFLKPQPSPPPEIPVSVYMANEWDHIPINVPAASMIHVIWIEPGFLKGVNDYGAFENISSSPDKSINFPSEHAGRWMTPREQRDALHNHLGIPNLYAFRCTFKNYSSVTIQIAELMLIVETGVKRSHTYPIYLNPLGAGDSFTFYLINKCSSGEPPIDAQWAPQVKLRVSGETKLRIVTVNFEKTNFPNQLMMFAGPSVFLWNGTHDCKWDSK